MPSVTSSGAGTAPSPASAEHRASPASKTAGSKVAWSGVRTTAPAPQPALHVSHPSAAGPAPPPGTFVACADPAHGYPVHTAWAPTAASPALLYTGTTIPDRLDECADVLDAPRQQNSGLAAPPRGATPKSLAGIPAEVLAKAISPQTCFSSVFHHLYIPCETGKQNLFV